MAKKIVAIEGLDHILRNLSPELYEKPLEKFFSRAGVAITNKQAEHSPVDHGRLKSSLGMGTREGVWEKVRGGGLEIGTNVMHRGVSYPRILDESSRHHYIGTQRQGALTKDWFSKGPDRAKSNIDKAVATFAKDVGKRWKG